MTLESMAAFARRMKDHIGREVHRGTVTRWAQEGRIVLVDGKVDVEASLEQLRATEGSRPDVAERHAREHAQKQAARSAVEMGAAPEMALDRARRIRAVAEARIKAAEAEMREMERDKLAGRLVEKEEVDFVLRDYGATLRGLLEAFADRVAPLVLPFKTLDEVHAVLAEEAERVLVDLAESMKRKAKDYRLATKGDGYGVG